MIGLFLHIFLREIGQFQSTRARFGECKTTRPHVNMSTWCRHVNTCPCSWLQLVTEVPMGIWIRDKFRLKIDRSVKTPWQEYGVVAGSYWWAPADFWSITYVSCDWWISIWGSTGCRFACLLARSIAQKFSRAPWLNIIFVVHMGIDIDLYFIRYGNEQESAQCENLLS